MASTTRDRFELGVQGVEGLAANFHKADAILQQEMSEAIERGAERIFVAAYAYTPVRTRFMQNHLRAELTELTWSIGWDASDFYEAGLAFYPEFVELGTRFMEGQFPLTRAYDENEQALIDDVSAALARSAERMNQR